MGEVGAVRLLVCSCACADPTAITRLTKIVISVTARMMITSQRSTSSGRCIHLGRQPHSPVLIVLRNFCGTKKASTIGIFAHLKVCNTTTIITPESDAIGTKLRTTGTPITKKAMPSATIVGPRRDLPPLRQLIVDSPIIASPPIPPRKPETRLASPIDAITAELSEGVLM